MKVLLILEESSLKIEIKLFLSALFHMKTRVSLRYFVSYWGLKASSLAWKSAFYWPEHNARKRPHATEFWRSSNTEMKYINRLSWKSRGKNEVICLPIMFKPRFTVIKISIMAYFCVFSWWKQKISHSLWKIFKLTWKIFLSSFRKLYG